MVTGGKVCELHPMSRHCRCLLSREHDCTTVVLSVAVVSKYPTTSEDGAICTGCLFTDSRKCLCWHPNPRSVTEVFFLLTRQSQETPILRFLRPRSPYCARIVSSSSWTIYREQGRGAQTIGLQRDVVSTYKLFFSKPQKLQNYVITYYS